MCEPKSSGGGKVLVGTAVVAGIALAAASAQSGGSAVAGVPPVQAAPAAAGTPWLTISLSVLAGAALLGLILVAYRAVRRRRREAASMRRAEMHDVRRRRAPQRAIEAPPVPAQAWLDGKAEVRN
jgi:hypothetical protein